MADNTDNKATAGRTSADDDLARETDGLKRELANLRAVIAERADDAVAAASRATQDVVTPIRENPGVVSSAFVVGGIVGFLIGLAIGQSDQRSRHWYDRYR
jgi:F0F1-type ATP synthase assembly protein I